MATATPNFAQAPKTATAVATAANTTLTDSPDDTVLLFTAGSAGSVIHKVSAIARATNSATVLYLYVSADGGTTQRLVSAVEADAETLSTTDGPSVIDFGYTETAPLVLAAGERLYCAASMALTEGWVFRAEGADFA